MYIPSNDKCYEEKVFVATVDRVTKEVAFEILRVWSGRTAIPVPLLPYLPALP